MGKIEKAIRENKTAVRACQIELSLKAKEAPAAKKCAVRKSILERLKAQNGATAGGNPQDAPPKFSHA